MEALLATADEVDVIVSASAAAEAALSWKPRDLQTSLGSSVLQFEHKTHHLTLTIMR